MMSVAMIFDYLNIAMVIPVVFLAVVMLSNWLPKAYQMVKTGGANSGEDWLILGVTTGFLGFVFNALFWGAYFFVDFMQWEGAISFGYEMGPKVNVLTRHIPYGLSAAFHIIAFWKYNKTTAIHPRRFFALSFVWVAIFYAVLMLIAPEAS